MMLFQPSWPKMLICPGLTVAGKAYRSTIQVDAFFSTHSKTELSRMAFHLVQKRPSKGIHYIIVQNKLKCSANGPQEYAFS